MVDKDDSKFALYGLFVATAEKVGDRRAQANAWMLSVNSAIVALYGYLQTGKSLAASEAIKEVWLWAIPVAGILVCLAWFTLLTSYRSLNHAKFTVLKEIENELAFAPFTREEAVYEAEGRLSLSKIESAIPWTFAALYLAMVIAALGT
ncbi:MAG: RipA family octameric membrane protein [Geminicoccaceae bacterium]